MSKPIFKQYEDDENLMFVLKFPITVNFENDDISTYQGEYSNLIPMEREVKALKKILEFMEQDDILCKKFEDEISSLWGFYDISKGSRDIFFEEAKKQHQFKNPNVKYKPNPHPPYTNLVCYSNLDYLCNVAKNLSFRYIYEKCCDDKLVVAMEEFRRFMEKCPEDNERIYSQSYIELFAILAILDKYIIKERE